MNQRRVLSIARTLFSQRFSSDLFSDLLEYWNPEYKSSLITVPPLFLSHCQQFPFGPQYHPSRRAAFFAYSHALAFVTQLSKGNNTLEKILTYPYFEENSFSPTFCNERLYDILFVESPENLDFYSRITASTLLYVFACISFAALVSEYAGCSTSPDKLYTQWLASLPPPAHTTRFSWAVTFK